MNTAIVYESTHHGNTKKLLDAISEKYNVTLINAAEDLQPDLSGYDRIGFAAGIAFGDYYEGVRKVVEECLPNNKQVFFIYTCGMNVKDFSEPLRKIAESSGCVSLGTYSCLGYDTYGPLEAKGGLNVGHPDNNEINGAVSFYANL